MMTMKTGKTLDFNSQIIHSKNLKLLFKETTSDSVLIASQTSLRKAYNSNIFSLKDVPSKWILWSSNEDFKRYDQVEKASVYIGFGGGTAIDIAKYLAKRNNAICIAVPGMLSTNVFATNKVAKVTDSGKMTVKGVLPKEIWYDARLISLSKQENKYGLADAFSIYTALKDWELADKRGKEHINKSIYRKADSILSQAMQYVTWGYTSQRNIFDILLHAGYITNDYGTGRPESGSEHIIAKNIEGLVKVPHALAVCCGIMIMAQIQSQDTEQVQKCFESMGLFKEIQKQISPEILTQAVLNTKPRTDRYTYLDEVKLSPSIVTGLIKGSHIYD